MPERVTCDVCDVTTRKEVFKRHYNTAHLGLKSISKPFLCDTCEAAMPDKSALSSHHYYRHSRVRQSFFCDSCNVVCHCRPSIISHMQTHTASELVYHCDDCGARTTCKEYLALHMRSRHSKRHELARCDECEYSSWSKPHLSRHYHLGHLATLIPGARKGERLYACDVCVTGFFNRNGLLAHLRCAHADETKMFSCDNCGYTSKSIHNVKHHVKRCSLKIIRLHRHEEPTVCYDCDKAYIGSKSCQNLFDHWLRHHTTAIHWFAAQKHS